MAPHAGSPLPAIAMMLLALTILPVSDSIGKTLTVTLPILQLTWARFFFHLLVVLPVAALRPEHRRALGPRVALFQVLRGALLVAANFFFLVALKHMPLADSVAVLFVAPLIVTVLAPFALGEHVGIRRYTAAAIGFVGALVIIRPGAGAAGWYALLPLAAGFCYACYLLATRRLAGSAPPIVTLAYTAIAGAAIMSAVVPFVWQWPNAAEFGLMIMIGPIAALGHYLLIRAHERTQASLLAPFSYWQIVSSTAMGYLVFGDFPDRWTWVGFLILAASGIYVSIREQRLALARARAEGLA